MRYLLGQNWDIRTLCSFLGVTTSQVYQNWARGEKQEVQTDFLSEGAKLHWIGQRRDGAQDRVFLYFHGESNLAACPCFVPISLTHFSKLHCPSGGGFSFPAGPDFFRFLRSLQKDVSASLGDIGIALLEYCESRSHVHHATTF